MKKGVILAGGRGTRLHPLTYITNKHLLPVYNQPMIEYPLKTLIDMGCEDILIVSGGEHIGDFAEFLGDGVDYGVHFTYKVQIEAGGIAQALQSASRFIGNEALFPVILGDNYFSEVPIVPDKPTLFVDSNPEAARFGVFDPETRWIEEKPLLPKGDLAVTGLYVYGPEIFNIIRTLKPSARGELEITDLNNTLLKTTDMQVWKLEETTKWSDMGTFDSLMRVAQWQSQK